MLKSLIILNPTVLQQDNKLSQRKFTAITIDESNYRRLAALGTVPDSFNRIVGRLLDEHERRIREGEGSKNVKAVEAALKK